MAFDNGWPKHAVAGIKYSAHNEGEFNGATTWMVKRYNNSDDDSNYVECLFSADTKDELTAVEIAIKNNSWG
jgi:hypothetical protein